MMKKLKKFIYKNYLVILIFVAVSFVILVSVSKAVFKKPKFVYAKVKVSQGLWWANTSRPQIWMIAPIKKGLRQNDFLGRPTAEVISVTYYPWFQQQVSQFDTYMTLRLKVASGSKKNGYEYDRSTVSVGSAVNFEFPTVSVSGTVIELSDEPISSVYEEKIIHMVKTYGLEWQHSHINVGDKYFDGVENVFEILEKNVIEAISSIPRSSLEDVPTTYAPIVGQRVTLKAKIKVKKINGYYIFGEEQVVATGKDISLTLLNTILTDYRVVKIE